MDVHRDLTHFFEQALINLNCHNDTRAYIIGIYGKFRQSEADLSKHSVTLTYAQARDRHDFATYQNLGDWLFFTETMFPESLTGASEDYYVSVAQISYLRCYHMMRSWRLYEELSDEFSRLVSNSRYLLRQLKNT